MKNPNWSTSTYYIFCPLWLTSLSRYESTDSVSFNRATLHFPLRGGETGGNEQHVNDRKWAAMWFVRPRLDERLFAGTVGGWLVFSTWCVWRADFRTAGRGRALCGEAGVSVCLLAPSRSGSPSPPPAPLQKTERGENYIVKHFIRWKNSTGLSEAIYRTHQNRGSTVADKSKSDDHQNSWLASTASSISHPAAAQEH